ncbi:UbiB [Gracilaria domingensis]|nr:UbiB [Gracilaria domingensis]
MHWVVDQFRNNLQKELDFELEAASAMRTAQFFENERRVCVPTVYTQYTTDKVLVMQYIDGFRVDDVDRMHHAGIGVQNVAQAVVDAFAQMIFVNGFVHCDPHAGNLMVTADERDNFKLYLLDHGLAGAAQLGAGGRRVRAAGRAGAGQRVLTVPAEPVVELCAPAGHGPAREDERGGTGAHPAGRDGRGSQVAGGRVAADRGDPGRPAAGVQDELAGAQREQGAGREREPLQGERAVRRARAARAERARARGRRAARGGEQPRGAARVAGVAAAVEDGGSRRAVDGVRGG